MNWEVLLERMGYAPERRAGVDPIDVLGKQAALARAIGDSTAKVTVNVGTSAEYGALKVSTTVSLECIQSDEATGHAGEAAFMRALELTNDGCQYLGLEPLRTTQ